MANKRRHYLRVSVALPFHMHLGRQTFIGKTYNISMNGVYVSIIEGNVGRLGAGLIGKCQLTLNEISITLNCQVLRAFNKELALQFVDLSPAQCNLLRSLILCGNEVKPLILAHQNNNPTRVKATLSHKRSTIDSSTDAVQLKGQHSK